jgi:hypothetical protein
VQFPVNLEREAAFYDAGIMQQNPPEIQNLIFCQGSANVTSGASS